MNEQDFQYAVAHPEARQGFVERIDLGDVAQYVQSVLYCSYVDPSAVMKMCTLRRMLRKSHYTIFVHPVSFDAECTPTFSDFKSMLIDHEGFHAREASEARREKQVSGVEDMLSVLVPNQMIAQISDAKRCRATCEQEIRAYTNQLRNARARGISPEFHAFTEERLRYYENSLQSIDAFLRAEQVVTINALVGYISAAANFIK